MGTPVGCPTMPLIQINAQSRVLRHRAKVGTKQDERMKTTGILMVAVLTGGVGLMGCVMQPQDPGEQVYQNLCVICHGKDARGTGPLADDLAIRPADLTQLAAANEGVFPSSHVMAKVYGYPGRYQLPVMPEFGPVLEGETVLWTDETGTQVETPLALVQLHDYLKRIQTP